MKGHELLFGQPLAITPEALEGWIAIAERAEVTTEMVLALHGYDAVAARDGRPLDNTRSVMYRNGVAVVPLHASIVRHGGSLASVSGAVSVEALSKDFHVALNDQLVRAILLTIDSPGGEVNGIHELANMIYDGRKVKPITAYISSLGASAAYWLASACTDIVADATAQVGSIGVVGAMPNPDHASKRSIEFVSSQSPHKRTDIKTEGGRAVIQKRVDALADVFVADVARNRGVSVETVLKDFGQGGVFIGRDAKKAGLIDRIGSFEQTLAALAAGAQDTSDLATGAKESTVADEQAQQGQPRGKGFWARWISGDSAEEEMVPTADMGVRRESAQREDPRIAELEAQLKATQDRQFAAEADAFTEGLVRGNQALPREAGGLREEYIQAARDDAREGVTTRVARMKANAALRPDNAAPVGERLKGQFALLPNVLTTATADEAAEIEQDEADAEKFAAARNRKAK